MLNDLRPVLVVARREIRDQFRDWRIIIPILFLTLLFPGIMNFTAAQAVSFVERYGANLIGERLIPFLLMIVGFFPISISMVIALESFVGEKERRSIEPLLTSPLRDFHLYLGKLLAVLVPPLIAAFLGIGVYLIGVNRQVGWVPEPALLVQIILLTSVQALVMVSGAVVISTQATSVRAANLLASFIVLPVAFLIQGESMVMFWGQYQALWWVIVGLVALSALLLRTGISHFNREELLGREVDVLNVRWMWSVFKKGFWGDAFSTWRDWYLSTFGLVFRSLAVPFAIMLGLFAAAVWIGVAQSANFPIPAEAFNFENLQVELFKESSFALLDPAGVPLVLFHNLRVVVLAMLIGVFSFGVGGVLALMLPMVIIGYFIGNIAALGISPLVFILGFVAPHGVVEIPALMIAGASILKMAASIVAPSQGQSISDVWLRSFGEWLRVVALVVLPLLFAAALIEVLVTPNLALMLFR